jgi:hypothetical protein
MRIVVTGDFREPLLLDTDKATGLIIYSDSGKPNVIYRMLSHGKGWLRYTKGEDQCFDDIAHSLGISK